MAPWYIAAAATALFCTIRAVVDLRQRRYAWGAVGLLLGLAVVLTPLPTQSIRVEIPPPVTR